MVLGVAILIVGRVRAADVIDRHHCPIGGCTYTLRHDERLSHSQDGARIVFTFLDLLLLSMRDGRLEPPGMHIAIFRGTVWRMSVAPPSSGSAL